MRKEHAWRFTFFGTLFSVLGVMIVFQMVRFQLDPEYVKHFEYLNLIYEGTWKKIKPERGMIYDRSGRVLAGSATLYEIGIDVRNVKNPHTLALTLNVVLGLDYNMVYRTATGEEFPDRIYVVMRDFVPQELIDRIEAFRKQIKEDYQGITPDENANPPSLAGLVYSPHLERSYPENDLAANLVGFVNREGLGLFGVEAKFNEMLEGDPKEVFIPFDPNLAEDVPDVPPGASVVLTIDRAIQKEMEEIIDRAVEYNGAESGTILVMAPQTGEILAMATTPRLDLNKYWQALDLFKGDAPYNPAISQAYEPGSVFKVLTMAAAFDKGVVNLETTFLDTGVYEIGGTFIYNWNSGAWGVQTMQGCLQHSLNVCLAWVADELGAKDFYTYMDAFGIGRLTGIELAGEVSGRLKVPGDADWYDADLGTNAFGQGVAATPIQMATAVSAIANGGKLMAPRIIRSLIDQGYQKDFGSQIVTHPISEKTSRVVSEMLARSLEEEASDALVEGYRLAGKTGTAEIPTPVGYSLNVTNASFVGWGPLDDPQFLVYVWLEKPTSSPWGSVVAAPVFHQAVERLVVLMDIPPDAIRREMVIQ